jgi:ketosteroid isomerase-like protein
MSEQNVELARRGYEALMSGDLDTVLELFDPNLTWQGWGPPSGDCHSRAEAMVVIKERLQERAIGELVEIIDVDEERIVVVMRRSPESRRSYAEAGLPPGHDETANLVTVRSGKVVAMQDYKTKAEALEVVTDEVQIADRVSDLIPFVHVKDPERSIGFYERLGFRVTDTHYHADALDWVALESGQAKLMLARASAPIEREQQAVLFYLYSDDLAGLRERLLDAGLTVGEIVDGSPGPRQEMSLADPDGHCLMVAQVE